MLKQRTDGVEELKTYLEFIDEITSAAIDIVNAWDSDDLVHTVNVMRELLVDFEMAEYNDAGPDSAS